MCAARLYPFFFALCLFVEALLGADCAWALPWDVDLFTQQSYQANEISRAAPIGTVPIGQKVFRMTTDEAEKLSNPITFNKVSVWRGRRLWNANCFTCHGATGKGDGPVGPAMVAPSLLDDFYRKRTDGRIFGVLLNGGTNMPRYGYKFSEREKWDLINYLRFLQGRDVEGIERPK